MIRARCLAVLWASVLGCVLCAGSARAQVCGFTATVDTGFPILDMPAVQHTPYLVVAREQYKPGEGEHGRQALFVRLSGGAARVNGAVRLQGGAEVVRVLATDEALDASDAEWGLGGVGADYRGGEPGRGLEGDGAADECPDRVEPDAFCVRQLFEVDREAVHFWLDVEDGERDELRILIDYPALDYIDNRSTVRLVVEQYHGEGDFWGSEWVTREPVGLVVGDPESGVLHAEDGGAVLQLRPARSLIAPISPLRILADRVWFGALNRLSQGTQTVRVQNRWMEGCDLESVESGVEAFVGRYSSFGPDSVVELAGFPEGSLAGAATAEFEVQVTIPAGQAYGAYYSRLLARDEEVSDADSVDMYVVVVPRVPVGGPCFDPLTQCGDSCVDTRSNCGHCGGCDQSCPNPQLCAEGVCVEGCPADLRRCGCSCVDTAESLHNCGACGRRCRFDNATRACLGGAGFLTGCFLGWVRVPNQRRRAVQRGG